MRGYSQQLPAPERRCPGNGWTAYPPLAIISDGSVQTDGIGYFFNGQNMWLLGVIIAGFSSVFGSLNYVTTIIKMRAPGMTLMRMPLTTWSLFITAILSLFSTPVLTGTLIMQLMDRSVGTSFFNPGYLHPGSEAMSAMGVRTGPCCSSGSICSGSTRIRPCT